MSYSPLVIEPVIDALLFIHVLAGIVGLVAALIAASNRKGSRMHRRIGMVFFWSMLTIGVTAIPVTFFRPNPFLFFIALFSFYMAYAGYRRGRSTYTPNTVDVLVALAMVSVALVMIGFGFVMVFGGRGLGWALVAFGGLGFAFGLVDTLDTRRARTRIQKVQVHLSRMLGGTIATITAVLVQQVTPLVQAELAQIVLWLGPTIILTPLIVLWQIRIQKTGRYRLLAPRKSRQLASERPGFQAG